MAGKPSINRFRIGTNVLLQTVALFVILVMVNIFAFRHFQRWDFSRDQKYALSEQSRAVLEGLKKPVKLIVYFAGGSELGGDAIALAKEYENLSQKKVAVEVINPYMSLSRAREIAAQYKLGGQENVIIFDYDGRSKIVQAADLAEYEPSLNPLEPPSIKAFKGEQVFTGALLEVTEQGTNPVRLIAGHGGLPLEHSELEGLRIFLERQNISLESLQLDDTEAVPEDTRILLLIGLKYDLSEQELGRLRAYWERKGRLLCLLDPTAQTPNLLAFFESVGVRVNNDRVLKTVPMGPVTGVVKDVRGDFLQGSPITRQLGNVSATFLGGTQSLTLEPERVKDAAIKLQPLIMAAQGYWAEAKYEIEGSGGIFFDGREDTAAPFIAASVEKGALDDARVQVESSRMIIVGNSTFIETQAMTSANLDFLLSSVNWLLDRESMIGIAPKAVRNFSLNLTESQLGSLAMLTMGAIPGAAAVLGFFAWLRRRR